jgi:hypothetical protein
MHVTLLVPDLFWPRDDGGAACRELKLPALELLLARARRRSFPPLGTEAWLCQAFEVERQQDWPVAPLTLAYDGGGEAGDHFWLRADPVHLAPHRDRLTLIDSPTLKPGAEDAAELVSLLNRHFVGDNLAFHAPHPARWYVRAPGTPRLLTREMSQAAGRDIAGALPTGEDSLRWRRTLNEIQMLLHEHPVNQRREARGELPINSVWLWGGGRRTSVPGQHFTHVAGANALALALAARTGAETATAADAVGGRLAANPAARLLVVAETSAARHGDERVWREVLAAMERDWLAPLHDALRRRKLEGIEIVALHPRGCERFEVTATDLLKFWRRPRPLSSHAPTGN